MDKPAAIRQLQTALGLELEPFPGPPEQLEELTRYRYQNHYALDAEGREVIGLNLRSNGLTDAQFGALAPFTQLQALNLSENNFTRLALPAEWANLRYLDLSKNKALKQLDFHSPHTLPLEWLDLNECALEMLEVPAFLRLQKLDLSRNQLRSLRFQGACPALWMLDASNNQMKAFELPGLFGALKYLYLNDNRIDTLLFRSGLPSLQVLHLRKNKLDMLPLDLTDCFDLQALYVYDNPMSALPKELISSEEQASSWEAIKAFLLNLEQGAIKNDRVKIILVGNGRVGKTSLFRRLKNQPFDPKEKYTHGIQVGNLSGEHLPEIKPQPLQASVWDFGGQEIFYATHQFFLSDDALYILAWTSEKNVQAHRERDKEDLPFRGKEKSQPCEYWLENIRLSGPQSPLLMVQTHWENVQNREQVKAAYQEDYGAEFLQFDAETDYGLVELKKMITDKIKTEIPLFGKDFPRSYESMARKIEGIKEDPPVIGKDEFIRFCSERGVVKGTEDQLLEYLHKTGIVVYYDKDDLRDVIYTNPDWLTREVYRLINHQLETKEGRITPDWLEQHLPEYSDQERARLIELLKAFELIFEDSDEDGVFWIVPQYLSGELRGNAKSAYNIISKDLEPAFVFRFPKFMPDNVMINFLSRYGPFSDKMYWRSGICFTNSAGVKCAVQYMEAERSLVVLTDRWPGAAQLQREVCEAFYQLSKKANAEVSLDGTQFVSWQGLLDAVENESTFIKTVDGAAKPRVDSFKHLTGRGEWGHGPEGKEAPTPEKAPAEVQKPKVYFSYAWGDEREKGESREKLVNDLYESLENEGFCHLKRDKKDAKYRSSLREFMGEIGRSDFIITVISDKYLKSPNCMYEMLQIFRKSGSETDGFREKIFPVILEDANIYDPIDRLDYVGYWQQRCKKLEQKIAEVGLSAARSAVPDFDLYLEIQQQIGLLANVLADIITLEPQVLRTDDFAEIKNAIRQRAETLNDRS
ncbi:MAG: COR domain-containing protein [Saprospiraceae bacterium]